MKALSNLKVLDLSRLLPGNFCSMMLADYGADVIKVELPKKPDPVRYFNPKKQGLSYWHIAVNRNKKSITLDYTKPQGRNILLKLMQESDILIESWRPGLMEKWQISYDQIKEIAPQLIYASISGYGQKDRKSTRLNSSH